MKVFTILLRDIEKTLELKKYFDLTVKLLKEYH